MQIQLNQREIEAALKMYITNQGIGLTDKTVSVNFTAGRGATGLTAELDIVEASDKVPAIRAVAKAEVAPETESETEVSVEPKEENTKAAAASLFGS